MEEMTKLYCFLMFWSSVKIHSCFGYIYMGSDKQPSTLSVAILVVLDENPGALTWRAIMSDKKLDVVCICDELIELDLSFSKAFDNQ